MQVAGGRQEKQVCSSEGTVAGMGCYTLAFVRRLVSFFFLSLICPLLSAKSFLGLQVVESRKGITPSRSHGTVREPLNSYGSSYSNHKVITTYGRTKDQCGNNPGLTTYFFCNHLIAARVDIRFTCFTHLVNRTFN
jgi:hypothetical protein